MAYSTVPGIRDLGHRLGADDSRNDHLESYEDVIEGHPDDESETESSDDDDDENGNGNDNDNSDGDGNANDNDNGCGSGPGPAADQFSGTESVS